MSVAYWFFVDKRWLDVAVSDRFRDFLLRLRCQNGLFMTLWLSLRTSIPRANLLYVDTSDFTRNAYSCGFSRHTDFWITFVCLLVCLFVVVVFFSRKPLSFYLIKWVGTCWVPQGIDDPTTAILQSIDMATPLGPIRNHFKAPQTVTKNIFYRCC